MGFEFRVLGLGFRILGLGVSGWGYGVVGLVSWLDERCGVELRSQGSRMSSGFEVWGF